MPVSDDVTLFLRAKDEATQKLSNVLVSADALQNSFDTLRKSGESIGFDPFKDADFIAPLAGIESLVKSFDKLNIATKAGSDNLLLFKATAYGAAAVAGYQILSIATGLTAAQEEQNRQNEIAITLEEKRIELIKRRVENEKTGLAAVIDTAERTKQGEEAIASLNKQLDQELKLIKDLGDARLKAAAGGGLDFLNLAAADVSGGKFGIDTFTEGIDEAKARSEELKKSIVGVREELTKLEQLDQKKLEEQFAKDREAAKAFTDQLQKQVDVFGLSALELDKYHIGLMKLEPAERVLAIALAEKNDAQRQAAEAAHFAAAEQERLQSAGDALIDSLRNQAIALQIGSDGAQLYQAKLDGVSDAVLNQAEAFQQQIAAMKEYNKEQERAKQIIETLKSPTEKLADQFAELESLQRKGLLSNDQFDNLYQKLEERVASEANKGVSKQNRPELAATESRFLTRGRGDTIADTSKQTADNTKKMMEEIAKMVIKMNLLEKIAAKEPVKIERIG